MEHDAWCPPRDELARDIWVANRSGVCALGSDDDMVESADVNWNPRRRTVDVEGDKGEMSM
jgi:hypothetical protein